MATQQIEQLVKMANQIAVNFGEERNLREASRRTGEHMEKFWTKAMQEQLFNYASTGPEGVSPAVALLVQSRTKPNRS